VGFAVARQGKLRVGAAAKSKDSAADAGIPLVDFLYLQAGARGLIVASLLSTVPSTILP